MWVVFGVWMGGEVGGEVEYRMEEEFRGWE